MTDIEVPRDVSQWLFEVFAACNQRVTEKLCNNPNMQEEWLDYSWIEQVSRFSAPLTLSSSWTVRLQAHFLSGLRHFRTWEIGDIGVLLFIRSPTRVERSKVVLLQSKRLYPTNMAVTEETTVDYQVGFARLADPEDLRHSLTLGTDYEFTDEAWYGAFLAGSDQTRAIQEFEKSHALPVYDHLYNPWCLPFARHVPIDSFNTPEGDLEIGVRIVSSEMVHGALRDSAKGYRPSVRDITQSGAPDTYGWRLEQFIAAELLECREGARFDSIHDRSIEALFTRRSGPIAAAIAITAEAPAGLLD
jgi:hypothetical protein